MTRFIVEGTLEEELFRRNKEAASLLEAASQSDIDYVVDDLATVGKRAPPPMSAATPPGGAGAPSARVATASAAHSGGVSVSGSSRGAGAAAPRGSITAGFRSQGLATPPHPREPKRARLMPAAKKPAAVDAAVALIVGMGFGADDAALALKATDGHVDRAVDMILTGNLPINLA